MSPVSTDPSDLPTWMAQYVVDYGGPGQSGHVQNIGLVAATDGVTPINQGDCDNFRDTWADNITIFCHTAVTQLSVTLLGDGFEFANTTTKVGTIGGDMMPLNNAYLIKKVISGGSDLRSGRIYVPGVAEVKIDNAGQVDNSFKSSFQTELDDFMSDLAGHDLVLMVGHTAPSLEVAEVTQLSLQPLVSNQRRRIRR